MRGRSVRAATALAAVALLSSAPAQAGAAAARTAHPQWASTGPVRTDIRDLAYDPVNPSKVFALAYNTGVFVSTDGGDHWQLQNEGLADLEVTSIAVDPVDPSTVFVGTLGDGIYRSRDDGLTWKHVLSTYCCPNFLDVAVDPGNHLRVLAPTFLTHAYASFDGGDTWVHLFHGLEWDLTSVEFDPSSRDTIHVSNVDYTGVQRSRRSANGLYWVGASQGLHQHDVLDLSLDVLDPDVVYAATIEDGVYKTVDAAGSWVPASSGLTDFDMTVVRSSPLVAGLVLVGTTTAGLFLSHDGAASWEATPLAGVVNAITFHPTDPGTVLAGTPRGIYRSVDGGVTWAAVLGSA